MKKSLPQVTVNDTTFYAILANCKHTVKCDSVADKLCGYPDKHVVYYTSGTDSDTLIVKTLFLNEIIGESDYKTANMWHQTVCIRRHEQKEACLVAEMTPIKAMSMVNAELQRHYTEKEIEDIYSNNEDDFGGDKNILHDNIITHGSLEKNVIYKFKDCRYEDINSAYGSELSRFFPKAANKFNYWFEHRHDNNNKFKNLLNFFVGCLTQSVEKYKNGKPTRDIHPKFRNRILNNITDKMNKRLNDIGSEGVLYLNTDGLIVQHPKHILPTSSNIGEFKLEAEGDVYMLWMDGGWLMQYTNTKGEVEIKGSISKELRDKIDLSVGKAATFKWKTVGGNRIPTDIKEKIYEIIEIN